MTASDGLEERYERLLRWYPPAHREMHGEEMLGVLMEASEPGRRRPSVREALDLARGGLVIRARRLRVDADTLAVLSLVAPLVLLIGTVIGLHEVAWFVLFGPEVPPWQAFPEAPAFAVWPVLLLLGFLGWRRTAAVGAWVATAALAFLLYQDFGGHYLGATDKVWWVGLAVLGATALTLSAGPRRGVEVLGARRSLAVVVAVGLVLLVGAGGSLLRPGYWIAQPVLALVVAVACLRGRPTLRWAGTLAGSLAAIALLLRLAMPYPGYPTVPQALALAAPFAAVLAVLLGGLRSREPVPSLA